MNQVQKVSVLACALVLAIVIFLVPPRGAVDFVQQAPLDNPTRTHPKTQITLVGASQFGEAHIYTRTIRKFEELVGAYYDGDVNFEMYLNSELGIEKDFFAYMSLGIAMDYSIVTASHMSTFASEAPLIDTPFLFRDLEHWSAVVKSDVFKPIEDAVYKKADVLFVGYAGGGVRNLIVNRRVTNVDELRGLRMRVMGAPIQANIFQSIGAVPSVIAYNEVYNAIQTGVIEAVENEASSVEQMKFYEVGPEISLTQHAFTLRPIMFSGKTFRRLPADLQSAILRAGREAGDWGREIESAQDSAILARLENEKKLRLHSFSQREELLRMAEPVKNAYAKKIKAESVLDRINQL
ncbi:MAG: TRAP transporter substrate-binding protein [Pirellula sp.]